ncbi:MAG: PIN domain-containing protein [Candidatus Blackburnbacteria bacterium]|nr:PIN domain-containing protein [Candidatus Blackburnbacteria bacterium]
MNPTIVADTSALISLFSPNDLNHKLAENLSLGIKRKNSSFIIPGEIATEVINVFGKKISHEIAVLYGRKILNTKEFTILETTPEIRFSAFAKFQKQPKSVSFTDCLVMAFADEYATKEVFGFNDVFRKNGYIRFGIDKK